MEEHPGTLTSSLAPLKNILSAESASLDTLLYGTTPQQKSLLHCLKLTKLTVYTIFWGGSTLFLKHFRNNLLNIYSFGLNRAEPTVAEPAFITSEDRNKPRTVQSQATDKYWVGQKVCLVFFCKIKDTFFIFTSDFIDLDILSMSAYLPLLASSG